VEKRVMEFANSNMGELTVAGFEAFAQGLEDERVRVLTCMHAWLHFFAAVCGVWMQARMCLPVRARARGICVRACVCACVCVHACTCYVCAASAAICSPFISAPHTCARACICLWHRRRQCWRSTSGSSTSSSSSCWHCLRQRQARPPLLQPAATALMKMSRGRERRRAKTI